MIRNRLRITLLLVLSVVLGLGVGTAVLIRTHTRQLESLLQVELSAIESANTILFHANSIQVRFLRGENSTPAEHDGTRPADPLVLQSLQAIESARSRLRDQAETRAGHRAVAELDALIDNLRVLLGGNASRGAGADLLQDQNPAESIIHTVAGISRLCQRLGALHSARVEQQLKRSETQNRDTIIYVAILALAALFILCIIYRQVDLLTLRPIATLTESVKEIEKQNFELSLPVERNDEIGALSLAYNDMASELRRLYRETDDRIVNLNARNRALLTAMPHAVIVLDEAGTLVQVNPEAEAILDAGGTAGRLPAKLEHLFTQARESGQDYLPEDLDQAVLFRIDEAEHFFLPRVFQLPPDEDTDATWGIILTDVSRFRWLDDMKMNALATVSHEIKTPLTSIRMVLHLLLEQKIGPLSEMQEEMVGSASADCERLLTTLGNLLQLGRLNSGSKNLELVATPAREIFATMPLSLKQLATEKNVRIGEFPDGDDLTVMTDPVRISQVVTNLVSNAVKFSPPDAVVELSYHKQGPDHVRFEVRDHGPGVPLESQDKLFDRFYRAPGQSYQGTGLGLSIAREIIHAHEGRIGCLNEPETPTTFYFDLPIA